MIVIITPCLLGFDVKTKAGENGFTREQGIYSASELVSRLIATEPPIRVILR